MDNLKSLFESKQYKLITDLFSETENGEEAFYVSNAFIQLNNLDKALAFALNKQRIIWDFSPTKCMDLVFNLRFTLKQFDEAYKDLRNFENYPYVSQEIEEILREMPKQIRQAEKDSLTAELMDDDTSIRFGLKSDKDSITIAALRAIKVNDAIKFADYLVPIVENENKHVYLRSYSLMLLVACNYDKEIIMKKRDQTHNLIPKDIQPPFTSKRFDEIEKKASLLCENPTVLMCFKSVLSNYQLIIYPNLVEDQNIDLLVAAILYFCAENLHAQVTEKDFLNDSFTKEELDKKIAEIREADKVISFW